MKPTFQHPSAFPAIDINQGFTPPFTVDLWEFRQSETIGVFPDLPAAARAASRRAKACRYIRTYAVEITDAKNRSI